MCYFEEGRRDLANVYAAQLASVPIQTWRREIVLPMPATPVVLPPRKICQYVNLEIVEAF
jgi:hypothetical protein